MAWFKREKQKIKPVVKKGVPDGLWVKCPDCTAILYQADLEQNTHVCPKCAHHFRMGARVRLDSFFDPDTSTEIAGTLGPIDILKFKDTKRYKKLSRQVEKLSERVQNYFNQYTKYEQLLTQ